MRSSRNRVRQVEPRRDGLAATELAVCLPVVALVVFASIEACSLIFLQQTLQTTAYETARFAVAPNSNSAYAIERGEQVLADRDVQGATIELDPPFVEDEDRGTIIEASVQAPLGQNRMFPAFFYGNQTLTATVTMMRE